jgi:hypothetical protein
MSMKAVGKSLKKAAQKRRVKQAHLKQEKRALRQRLAEAHKAQA